MKSSPFSDFAAAREYVRALGLNNLGEWLKFARSQKPADIPQNPQNVYKDEWKGWADFLGADSDDPESKSRDGDEWKGWTDFLGADSDVPGSKSQKK